MIILDTNVVSEVFRPSPSPPVIRWLASLEPLSVFTTTITLAELLYGIESMAPGRRRTRLAAAIHQVFANEFEGRILPFDEEAARLFPKIVTARNSVGQPISQLDAMIAAITRSRHGALATRNTRDFEHCGLRLINPWTD